MCHLRVSFPCHLHHNNSQIPLCCLKNKWNPLFFCHRPPAVGRSEKNAFPKRVFGCWTSDSLNSLDECSFSSSHHFSEHQQCFGGFLRWRVTFNLCNISERKNELLSLRCIIIGGTFRVFALVKDAQLSILKIKSVCRLENISFPMHKGDEGQMWKR